MLKFLALLSILGLASCNERPGHRQEMEEATTPNDYTSGKDVKESPHDRDGGKYSD